MKIRVCAITSLSLLLLSSSLPKPAKAIGAGSLLLLDKGARASALASAVTAQATGPFGFCYNPAGLAGKEDLVLGFEHNEWGQGMRGEFFAASYPVMPQAAVAAALDYFSYGTLETVDEQGRLSGETFSPAMIGLKAGYGMQLSSAWAAGLQLGFYQESIKNYSDTAGYVSLGAEWQAPWEGVEVGMALRNLGATASGYSLPATGVIGCALTDVIAKQLTMHTEIGVPWVNGGIEMAVAAEYQAVTWVNLRVGYRHSFQELENNSVGFSGGVGLEWRDWQLNYALKPVGAFGLTHQVSLEFSMPAAAKKPLEENDKKASQSKRKRTQTVTVKPAQTESEKLNEVAQKRFAMGMKQYNAGNYKAAIQEWKLVLDLSPGHVLAKEYIQKTEAAQNDDLEGYRQKARQTRLQHDLINEIANWKKALAILPNDKEAQQGLQQAQVHAPEIAQIHYNNGLDCYVKGRYKEAIQEWEKVLILNPQHFKALENIQKTKEKIVKIE